MQTATSINNIRAPFDLPQLLDLAEKICQAFYLLYENMTPESEAAHEGPATKIAAVQHSILFPFIDQGMISLPEGMVP
jgi:hypothetical protein